MIDEEKTQDQLLSEIGRLKLKLEEAQRTSENLYRMTLDSMDDRIHVIDTDFRIILFNASFHKWCGELGLELHEVIGRNLFELFPFVKDIVLPKYKKVLETGNTYVSEEAREFLGKKLYIESRIIPLFSEGKIFRYITVIRDISERKYTEEALRKSEEKFSKAFLASPDGIAISRMSDGTIKDVNEVLLRILDYEKGDVIGKTSTGLGVWDEPLDRESFVNSLREKGRVFDIETYFRAKHGRRVPILISGNVIDLDGETCIISAVRDITDYKESREALRSSEMKYRTLANNIPDIVCSVDCHGNIVAANDITFNLSGYNQDKVIGASFLQFVWKEDKEAVLESFQEGIREKRDFTRGLQFRIMRSDGSPMWVELNSHWNFDEEGNFVREDCVLRDITGRKRSEVELKRLNEELKHLNEELDNRVAERTRKLQEEIAERKRAERALLDERSQLARRVEERTLALSAANAELSRAARAKDEFLASMSHELRTPLSAILSITETLEEEIYGPVTDKQRSSLRTITESGQHLLSLINDILDISKIEAGKITLDMNTVPVEDVCQASLRLAKSQAHKKRLSLSLTIDSQASTVIADERYLKQILVNLLSNAVKFTPEGGRIGLEVTVNPDEQLITFAVWDTGIGIPPDKLPLLFKPFSQLDSSLSRQYGGTGLGLALVARLAEMHGGSVLVKSTPGEGSRFSVLLRWEKPLIEHPPVYEPVFTASIKQALVVEDSRGDAERITRYFTELGVSSVVYMQGNKVVEKALEVNPDVILLDLILPDIDGWQVLSMLKADSRTSTIPVIIVSVIDDHPQGIRMGAVDFIVKPVTREILKKALNLALKRPEKESRALLITPPVTQPSTGPLVLLAEDNEVTIANMSDYLKARGYRVTVARNGREAIDRVRESAPDIILMDIQMPGMDGLEATRTLKLDSNCAGIPIIALTALAMHGDRERCLGAGADAYLSKPLSLKKLIETIESLLTNGGMT